MGLISAADSAQVRTELAKTLKRPVRLLLFTAPELCEYCDLTRDLLSELAELHPNLSVEVLDLQQHAERAAQHGIDKAPALVLLGGAEHTDYGMRFYGIPAGYEFNTLLGSIAIVGSSEAALSPAMSEFLLTLSAPMHLQVFVTPTCPYCPRAALLAHRLAFASPQISADVVEVSEFPELGERYGVMGVPQTVIGEHVRVEGAVPEGMLLSKLKQALALD